MPFQKGNKINLRRSHISWCKGENFPEEMRIALIKRNKERIGKKHYMWRGDKVGYHALHDWVEKYKGKPTKCESCGKSDVSRYKIHWTNISGKYKRDLKDWKALCASCHALNDKSYLKRKRNEKGQFI